MEDYQEEFIDQLYYKSMCSLMALMELLNDPVYEEMASRQLRALQTLIQDVNTQHIQDNS